MHFAGFAVKAQGEFFFAVDQLQGFSFDKTLHAGHALGLLGAQTQRKPHAVFGDHQADLTGLFNGLVSGINHLHAVACVKRAGSAVKHIGQVAQGVFRVGRGWLHRLAWQPAHKTGSTRGLQCLNRLAAQGIEQGAGHQYSIKSASRPGNICANSYKNSSP